MKREIIFNNIKNSVSEIINYHDDQSIVINGDSLKILKKLPSHSISLILTDPPYHSTKKNNIINDTAFENDKLYVNWIKQFAKEWYRILKPNGSLFIFCSSTMESKLDNMLCSYFNILSHIVWTKPNDPGFDGWKGKMKKEALRQWYPHSERIIFGTPAFGHNLYRSYFGDLLRGYRQKCNISGHKLTELIGAFGKVNHGGAVSNWEAGRNIPSREQYSKICNALQQNGLNEEMPDYEDVIRPFEVNPSVEFTDIWNFNSVKTYKGKHPAEKPIDLLRHCIISTTYDDDIILDCFAGSGSSAVAAYLTGRKSISIEIDSIWCNKIIYRLNSLQSLSTIVLNGIKQLKDLDTMIETDNKAK